jgi:hypothetical protein
MTRARGPEEQAVSSSIRALSGRPRSTGDAAAHVPLSTAGNHAMTLLVQRTFWQRAASSSPGNTVKTYAGEARLPIVFGVSPNDLRELARDAHDYGEIANAAQFVAALTLYRTRHPPPVAAVTALDQKFEGNLTVHAGDYELGGIDTRVIFQLDAGQSKHDPAIMRQTGGPLARKPGGERLNYTKTEYGALAQGVPLELARAHQAAVFKKANEGTSVDLSVQGIPQSDGLRYEISMIGQASTGGGRRTLLVYYHCYPAEADEKRGKGKKGKK